MDIFNIRGLISGYTSQSHQNNIQQLERDLGFAKAFLDDVQRGHQELCYEVKDIVEKVKEICYDTEDLLEKVHNNHKGRFPLPSAKDRQINELSHKFAIMHNYLYGPGRNLLFAFIDSRRFPTNDYWMSREGFTFEEHITGREVEKRDVVEMLLMSASNSSIPLQETVSILSIVGMLGIGKTALAQLAFNDPQIFTHFDLRFWVWVGQDFGMTLALHRILSYILKERVNDDLELDKLQDRIREKIQGKRFLLVLDDFRCEDHDLWHQLTHIFANIGGRGSQILVTSSSMGVAQVIRNSRIYELKGLSQDHSWNLFKRYALDDDGEPEDAELLHIAKQLALTCANHPLAIRMLSGWLRSQDRGCWHIFTKQDYIKSIEIEEIMSQQILRSFHLLTPELRKCFELCLMFPSTHVIEKEVLIRMWLALGYLVPPREDQSMEDIGEIYCSKLLQRFFFQDIQQDNYGNVISFKVHELLHRFGQQEAGREYLLLTDTNKWQLKNKIRHKIRHLFISEHASFIDDLFEEHYAASETLRSIFNLREYAPCSFHHVAAILSQCTCLRLLDLHEVSIDTLPDTFDRLKHLTYLDLSNNEKLKKLPTSITKLLCLQVLRLRGCKSLEELPEDLSRLIKIRYLDLSDNEKMKKLPTSIIMLSCLQTLRLRGCKNLEELPKGMGKLVQLTTLDIDGCNKLTRMDCIACLHKYTMKVVAGDNSKLGNRGKLINMKPLVNLKDNIAIEVENISLSNMPKEGSYIMKDAHLQALDMISGDGSSYEGVVHETSLEIKGYVGTKLTTITLSHFGGLQHLTTLSQLLHLKYLRLRKLWNIQSIEGDAPSELTLGATESMIFYPSLEKLVLERMPKLKGWWRDLTWMGAIGRTSVRGNGWITKQPILPIFPCLLDLRIRLCQSMTYFPPCPHVKQLDLGGVSEIFCIEESAVAHPVASASSGDQKIGLEKLIICYDARVFNSLFGKSVVPSDVDIELKYFHEEESLQVAREGFERCSSSLKKLSIDGLYKLKSLSGGGIELLTNLQSLTIKDCFELDLEEVEVEEDDKGMPWKSLLSLSCLKVDDIPKLVKLPKAFQYLTALQDLHVKSCSNLEALEGCDGFLASLKSLHIENCNNLKTLPECLGSMTSLRSIHVDDCSNLEAQPECLNSLMSRQIIHIKNCPKLQLAAPPTEISSVQSD